MKSIKNLGLAAITLLLITSFTTVTENVLVGRWEGKDKGDVGFLTFSDDGYATFEFDGSILGGESFQSNGVQCSMRFSIDTSEKPNTIDLVISKKEDKTELARFKGIYEMTSLDELHLALSFNDGADRPIDFDNDDIYFKRID